MTGKSPPVTLPKRYSYSGESLAGGQGEVFVCKDENLDRPVAVKTLHKVSNFPALLKEVAARAKIKSKHVVEMYELLCNAAGIPTALVLEFIPGKSLDDKSTIPADRDGKLRLLYQLACGLKEIHAASVIHRDIKPHNMKVDGAGVLRIYDLGISNLDASSASTVGAAGTLVYRAPELYQPPPIAVTTAADIYAFGVVAWHLFVGVFPSQLKEVPPQKSNAVPSIATKSPDLGAVAALVDRCLLVDSNQRPTAAMLADALNSSLTDGRQRGVFTYGAKFWELSEPGKVTSLTIGPQWGIKIAYDGQQFVIRDFTGDVFINNQAIAIGQLVPKSCVLTFGLPELGSKRAFLPFDSSQPEIVL